VSLRIRKADEVIPLLSEFCGIASSPPAGGSSQ